MPDSMCGPAPVSLQRDAAQLWLVDCPGPTAGVSYLLEAVCTQRGYWQVPIASWHALWVCQFEAAADLHCGGGLLLQAVRRQHSGQQENCNAPFSMVSACCY